MYTCWYCRELASSRFLKTLKGYAAREANRLLERTGQPFWQAESYDHWVRDEKQAERIIRRISRTIRSKPGWLRTRRTIGGPVPKPR
jgi:hypothetical protein